MRLNFYGPIGCDKPSPANPGFAPPLGARRLVIVRDEEGNQALRLVPEDLATYPTVVPTCVVADRRANED